MPTGQITSQLGNGSAFYYSADYYDIRDRLILTKSTNHLSGTDKEFVAYAFDGLPEKRFHEHSISGGSAKTEEYVYTYDDARRLKTTSHKLDGGVARMLSAKNYDLLGRLQDETLGGLDILKSTYTCDVRSRVTWKGDTQMYEVLTYTYGSNIQSQLISTGAGQSKYEYAYDGLSRLTSAAYTSGPGNFATSYGYDKQGNPLTIQRYGMTSNGVYGLVDNLTLAYDGNRLTSGNDVVGNIPYAFSQDFKNYTSQLVEYSYNTNGSMTKDLNRGISSIQYNILNLPGRIDIKNPVGEARNEYVYRSDGEKLRVVHRWNPSYSSAPIIGSAVTESSLTSVETTDYASNYVYVNNGLKRILTENGYIENGQYYFHVKDHLGNSRLVVYQSPSSQAINYYPFGMSWGDQRSPEIQPYKYTGKELDLSQGLNLYDYGARYYDPGMGRFTTMDPLAEKYYSISPYAYALNNPLRFADPTGMEPDDDIRKMEADRSHFVSKIIRSITSLFSIEVDASSQEGLQKSVASHESKIKTVQNATEVINTVNDALSLITPVGSFAEVMANTNAGNYGAALAAVPFSVLDVASMGKGGEMQQVHLELCLDQKMGCIIG